MNKIKRANQPRRPSRFLGGWFFLAFFSLPFFLYSQDTLLKVDAAVIPKILSRGESGQVVLRLTVPEGVLVLAKPEFVIEFKNLPPITFPKNFFTATDLELETFEHNGQECLKLDKVINIPISIALDAPARTYILEGKVKHVLRSVKKGWCLKTASKFYCSFSTRATLIKKKRTSPRSGANLPFLKPSLFLIPGERLPQPPF